MIVAWRVRRRREGHAPAQLDISFAANPKLHFCRMRSLPSVRPRSLIAVLITVTVLLRNLREVSICTRDRGVHAVVDQRSNGANKRGDARIVILGPMLFPRGRQ